MGAQRSKQHLLLIELLLAILFFVLSAAICSGIFVRAYKIGQDSADVSEATLRATQAAEVFKYANGDLTVVAALLEGKISEARNIVIYYDEEWQVVRQDSGAKKMTLTTIDEAYGCRRADIAVYSEGAVVFKISVKHAMLEGRY
jgi:hypothetical protein